jgi:hypothetical protein
MIYDQLHINWETTHQILYKNLGKKKNCVKFVPHSLTKEQKEHSVVSYEDFIPTWQTNPNFLNCIITGDQSGVSELSWNKTSKHAVKHSGKQVFQSPKICACNVKDENENPRFFFFSQPGCDPQRISAWRKNSEQWTIRTDKEKEVKQSLKVRPQFLLSSFFLHDDGPVHCAMTEELPGEPCVVEKATHLINLTLCQLTCIYSLPTKE